MKSTLLLFTIVSLFIFSCNNEKSEPLENTGVTPVLNYVDTSITSMLDPLPDDSLSKYLDGFAISSDTSEYNIALKKKNLIFTVGEYKLLRDMTEAPLGITAQRPKGFYRQLLPFSDIQKLHLDLISGLCTQARFLANRKNFTYPLIDSINSAQTGLGYSWGSKDYNARNNPPGEKDSCKYKIYGLDCSGFVYQLFRLNKIKIPAGTASLQRKPATLVKGLTPYFGDSTSFSITDLGRLNISDIRSGDILYFKNRAGEVVHIGLCLIDEEGTLVFYEASGSPNRCDENISLKKGIRGLIITTKLSTDKRDYSVVRIAIKNI